MLTEHFKLSAPPFGVTPDPSFLYLSNTHREALASLFYGIHAQRGFTALIAAPGMGKTTLLFHLLGLVMPKAKTAFMFQTLSGPEEFLRCLLTDLGVDDEGGNVAGMQAKLNSYLLQQSIDGRQVVVVIDEAQNHNDDVLEMVRMLSNFENPSKKLMHMILSGQPQLAQRLCSQQLSQLRQRISILGRLVPFHAAETRAYIEHRLRVAGAAPGKPLFSDEAYAKIAQHSGGIPRNINNLCFNSMSLACALKKPQVDASMVQETIDDLDLSTLAPLWKGSASRKAQTRVQIKPDRFPWPRTSRRYLTGMALGLFVAIGLLAYHGTSSRERSERQLAGASLPLRESVRDSNGPPVQQNVTPEDVKDQARQFSPQPQRGAARAREYDVSGTLAKSGHEEATAISGRRAAAVRKSPIVRGVHPTLETFEIRLLPEDEERLRHEGTSERDRGKSDAAPKQDQVPAKPTRQSEKR